MKITRATFKSFVNKNKENLLVKVKSNFDGMVDCVTEVKDTFTPATKSNLSEKYTLGIQGIWLVGQSRDWFKEYKESGLTGIEVSNCCGSFVVAIR
jgi:vesicle coat complex subunit